MQSHGQEAGQPRGTARVTMLARSKQKSPSWISPDGSCWPVGVDGAALPKDWVKEGQVAKRQCHESMTGFANHEMHPFIHL